MSKPKLETTFTTEELRAGLPFSEYRPGGAALIPNNFEKRWLYCSADDEWFTDGKVMFRWRPKSRVADQYEGRRPNGGTIIALNSPASASLAAPAAFVDVAPYRPRDKDTRLVVFDNGMAIEARYFDFITRNVKGATWRQRVEVDAFFPRGRVIAGPFIVTNVTGEVVAFVMSADPKLTTDTNWYDLDRERDVPARLLELVPALRFEEVAHV